MKKLIALMLALIMVFSMVACGGGSDAGDTAEEVKPIKIKLGHSDTTDNLIHKSLENFAAYVEKESGGRLEVDLYASEQLGSNAEMAEMVQMGSLDAMMLPQGQEANYAPKLNILGMPFLFPNYDAVYKVLDGEIGQELLEGLEENGMIQLAYWENGLRQTTNSVRAIEKPEDLKGLKIRTPEDKVTMAIFTALGASPAPMAFSELYLALQQGTFDGQENPVSNIHANNFQDVQGYLTITNHKYECKNMIFSLKTWNEIPEDLQAILLEGAKIYGDEHRKAIVDSADTMLAELEAAGMQVSRPDTTPFQDATASVYTDFYAENAWAEDLVTRIKAEIAG